MAAERPENAEERLVAEALQKAFGRPVAPAAFLAGREAVLAAAALSAEEVAGDEELVTAALENAFAVPLAPEVRAEHVAAIQAAARHTNVIPLRRFGHQVGRHAAAVVVAVGTLAGGSGVAAASTDALPGQMLYPVKRAVEQVMLTAAWTPTAEARVQAQLAARRLNEIELLLASGASQDLVAPLLSEYDQHVAVVEDLAITSAALNVAGLQEKAAALREQTVAAADGPGDGPGVDGAAVAAVPTQTASPAAVTTTEPPTSGPSESTTAQDRQAAPAPAASSTPAPKPASEPADTSSGSSGGSGSSGTTTTQPSPTSGTSPSPSPSPTTTPTPNRPPQSEVDEPKKSAPDQEEKSKPSKPEPTPTSSPTADPDRAPLSDSEPVYDAGPPAEWEEQSFVDGS